MRGIFGDGRRKRKRKNKGRAADILLFDPPAVIHAFP
jgi:hypothetical protein